MLYTHAATKNFTILFANKSAKIIVFEGNLYVVGFILGLKDNLRQLDYGAVEHGCQEMSREEWRELA